MKTFQAINGKTALVLIPLMGLMLANCSKIYTLRTKGDNSVYLSQSATKSSTDFPEEIATLERITIYHPDPSVQT